MSLASTIKSWFPLTFGPCRCCKKCGTIREAGAMHHAFGYGWFCSEDELQEYKQDSLPW